MKNLFVLLVVFFVVWASGCSGCDEVTGTQNNNASPDTSLTDTELDADNPDVVSNDAGTDTDLETCQNGQTRPCGSDVSECEFGEQRCINNIWGPCEGGIVPEPEQCNGRDDDCNGFIDDEDTLCSDLGTCGGEPQCSDGQCIVVGEAIDCSHLDGPCRIGLCSDKSGDCIFAVLPDETACDDDNFCSVGGTCQAGICQGQARDCSEADDDCNEGVCDEDANACVPAPKTDGIICDDELSCTTASTCQAGQCQGTAIDCSSMADQCNDATCDESSGGCVLVPKANNTSCEDGLYCTTSDTCQAGLCVGGALRSCTAAGGSCRSGVCDESTRSCTGAPVTDGTPCDDGLYCTTASSCAAGECTQPTTLRNCSASGDGVCQVGACDEPNRRCAPVPAQNGIVCSDGLYCTVNTTCQAGTCQGSARSCAQLNDTCNVGVCNEANDLCVAVDNGQCDPCENALPTARAGADQVVIPNATIALDGRNSTDPNNLALTYQWRVASRPVGSSSQLSSTTSATPTLLADVSGEFSVCLIVANSNGCVSSENCMKITVKPTVGLHIELTWLEDGRDLDVHYKLPATTWFNTGQGANCSNKNATACWFCTPQPDWNTTVAANKPVLDVDNETGFGPENINQQLLADGNGFRVGVHFWDNKIKNNKATARIRIFVGGVLRFDETNSLNCKEFWEAADINVSGGGTTVTVTSLNKQKFLATRGTCR
ncbi:MAG: hypothetical protein H0U74_15150 [Bradymonadaceae bacterium]|nr:hypothetical protein [Lujinxingiaceae bacterium]